jgi:hypothetical protein
MQFYEIIYSLTGLVAGGGIGLAFGLIQNTALRRNASRQKDGRLNTGWAVMPGSMRRVSYLVLALVLIQVVCPFIFANGLQWWLSAGVVLGYGVALISQLRQHLSERD